MCNKKCSIQLIIVNKFLGQPTYVNFYVWIRLTPVLSSTDLVKAKFYFETTNFFQKVNLQSHLFICGFHWLSWEQLRLCPSIQKMLIIRLANCFKQILSKIQCLYSRLWQILIEKLKKGLFELIYLEWCRINIYGYLVKLPQSIREAILTPMKTGFCLIDHNWFE